MALGSMPWWERCCLGDLSALTGALKAAMNQQVRLVLHIQEGRLPVGVGSRQDSESEGGGLEKLVVYSSCFCADESWHGGRYGSR